MVKILLKKDDCAILQKSDDNFNEFEIAFLKGNYDICYFLLYQYKNENNFNLIQDCEKANGIGVFFWDNCDFCDDSTNTIYIVASPEIRMRPAAGTPDSGRWGGRSAGSCGRNPWQRGRRWPRRRIFPPESSAAAHASRWRR